MPENENTDSAALSASAPSTVAFTTVNAETFAQDIKSPEVFLLDVRTPEEYERRHIENAVNIDVMEDGFLPEALKVLPKDKKIAVYCYSGRRSVMAAEQLVPEGFEVINLEGGITEWLEAGLPVVK